MSDLDVQLKYKNKNGGYDNLYPKTKGDIVQMKDGRNVEQILDEVTDLYNQVIEDGTNSDVNSAPEIIAARNGKSNLKTRLDEEHAEVTAQLQQTEQSINAQLAQTAPRNEVLLKADGVGLNDARPDLLSAIEGGAGTSFNLLSEPRDQSVTPAKTTFIKSTSNIFNKDDVVIGKAILSTTGELVDNASHFTSNYIAVNPSSTYVTNRLPRVAFYDAGKSYLSMAEGASSFDFDTPANCFYIRVHGALTQLAAGPQINKGSTLLPYEDFKLSLSDTIKFNVTNDDISDGTIEIAKTNFIKRSTNLYNPKTANDSYYLSATTGELVADWQYISTEFIKISSSHIAQAGFSRVIFYDKDKNYLRVRELSSVMSIIDNIPVGTTFIRLHINKADTVENPQINEGATLLPYEEYYLTIDGVRYEEHSEPKRIPSYYFPPENINGDYVTTNGVFEELDIVDLYAGYEALANANPKYITRKLLGKDASGEFDLFEYKLIPPQITSEVSKVRPKIVLVANVHGYEKPSAYSLYYMVKAICEDWKDNPILEYLRFNVEFVFIPLLNPYGFVNGNYANANGVNIQVNFPTRWIYRTDKPDHMHSGSEPASEVETQYCMTMLNENTDAMIFVDLHAQVGANEIAYSLIPDGVDYSLDVEVISKFTFEKLTRLFHKHYEHPIDEFVGRIDRRQGQGTIDAYASSLGITSTINEHFLKFKDEPNYYSEKSIKANTDYLINWVIITLNRFKDVY